MINTEFFKRSITLILNTDRINAGNLKKDPVHIIEDRTKFITTSRFDETDIQAPKVRKVTKQNKYLVTSLEINAF